MNPRITTLRAPSGHLRQLVLIRGFLILALAIATFWANRLLALPQIPITAIIVLLTFVNLFSLLRLRWQVPVVSLEITGQLLVDILAVAVLAFYTGGAANPFLSYILVPVCIAAAVLPGVYAWSLSLVAIALYGTLLVWNHPLAQLEPPSHSHRHEAGINFHLIGMWLNFALSALLISYFVVKMAAAVRQQQDTLNARREEDLRDEQLLAVATQAAGTAHELGTPLSSIKVLLADLAQDPKVHSLIGEDLTLLRNQVNECGAILQRLRQRADIEQLTHPGITAAYDYCTDLIDRWQLLRPDARADIQVQKSLLGQQTRFHPTIEQAIINVLNNAADASAKPLHVSVRTNNGKLIWEIKDQGKGFSPEAEPMLGKRPFTTKPDGLGIGLFLTHASIQRYGGTVKITTPDLGGTLTTITLPLEAAGEQ